MFSLSHHNNASLRPTICLCLDVDDMLFCFKNSKPGTWKYDVNGHPIPIQLIPGQIPPPDFLVKIGWYKLIEGLKQQCLSQGVDLSVHIITSKDGVDDLVDAAVTLLHPFLQNYPFGSSHSPGQMPVTYLFNHYCFPNITLFRRHSSLYYEQFCTYKETLSLLPSVHVVRNNIKTNDGYSITSKAGIMQYIESKLQAINRPPLGMILVDDRPELYKQNVEQRGYSFISAEKFHNDKDKSHLIRCLYFQNICDAITAQVHKYLNKNSNAAALVNLSYL